jgi:hypothetical protein
MERSICLLEYGTGFKQPILVGKNEGRVLYSSIGDKFNFIAKDYGEISWGCQNVVRMPSSVLLSEKQKHTIPTLTHLKVLIKGTRGQCLIFAILCQDIYTASGREFRAEVH